MEIHSKITRYGLLVLLLMAFFLFECGREDNPAGNGGTGNVVYNISSDPSGADCYVDGNYTGEKTPTILNVTEGTHSLTLKLCDYEDWTRTYTAVDGDTIDVDPILSIKFQFFDDFEDGAGNWTAGCPYTFIESDSYNGSNCVQIINDSDCSTLLTTTFEVPECLEPDVVFYYTLVTSGFVSGNLVIDALGGPHYERLDVTTTWTRVDVPSSVFENLTGTCTFSFAFSNSGTDTYRFSLDDFSLSAE